MKKMGFKQKTYQEVLEAKKAKKSSQNVKSTELTPYKKRLKKIKSGLPKWLKAIPESQSHGSGTYEKRLWKLTSDYVRIRDWYKFNKRSVDGKWLETWQEGQAGHYISYTLCKNMFKFDIGNIHLQSANSNQLSSASDGKKFGDELERRYGDGFCSKLENLNTDYKEYIYCNEDVILAVEKLLNGFDELEERPEYVRRAKELLEEYKQIEK